jgi:1,2-phenylacetyl-CoA epoxidase catalytic subunit
MTRDNVWEGSTYPVLKALGADLGDERFGGDRRLALLDDELPDWPAFIAANLLIDGALTTFVAACPDSSVEQMAARAKKILQEEGSHRAHAEAWAKRLCRGDQRDAFVARLKETWEQAGRWIGPDDDPAYAAAVEAGEVKQTPAHQRQLMRDWLTGVVGAEGVEIELPEPTDWSGWDADRRRWQP